MTTYYHAKLALCGRVDIKGKHAVSCIIRGLPEELRANTYAVGCSTPEALYNQFLAGLDSYSAERSRRTTVGNSGKSSGRPAKRTASIGRASVRCYNCQEHGNHLSRDCPRARLEQCWNCREGGHLVKTCPKRRSQNVTNTKQMSLINKANDSTFRQKAQVNSKEMRVYIDTDSETNLMSAPMVRRLGLEVDTTHKGVTLGGFGGGVAASLGEVRFSLVMADLQLNTLALVTDCNMGRIELLLGQVAMQAPGVTLVVRNNKAVLTKEEDMGEFFG